MARYVVWTLIEVDDSDGPELALEVAMQHPYHHDWNVGERID